MMIAEAILAAAIGAGLFLLGVMMGYIAGLRQRESPVVRNVRAYLDDQQRERASRQ